MLSVVIVDVWAVALRKVRRAGKKLARAAESGNREGRLSEVAEANTWRVVSSPMGEADVDWLPNLH